MVQLETSKLTTEMPYASHTMVTLLDEVLEEHSQGVSSNVRINTP